MSRDTQCNSVNPVSHRKYPLPFDSGMFSSPAESSNPKYIRDTTIIRDPPLPPTIINYEKPPAATCIRKPTIYCRYGDSPFNKTSYKAKSQDMIDKEYLQDFDILNQYSKSKNHHHNQHRPSNRTCNVTTEVTYEPMMSAKSQVPSDINILPSDRIFEIRKEKIMIKADRSSKSHSKIQDMETREDKRKKYIERDIEQEARRGGNNRSMSCAPVPSKTRFESDQDQFIDRDDEFKCSCCPSQPPPPPPDSAIFTSARFDASKIQNSDDIIYVPMIKDDFLKREFRKTNR